MDGMNFDVWYLNDELGSRIRHNSDSPSFRIATFAYEPLGGAFSILWPIRNVKYGDEVTRDYFNKVPDYRIKNLLEISIGKKTNSDFPPISPLKTIEWFQEWVRIMDEKIVEDSHRRHLEKKEVYKIYSDIKSLTEIESNRFDNVADPVHSDIIWQADHFKDFGEIKENQLISQFPNEFLLTTKVSLLFTNWN